MTLIPSFRLVKHKSIKKGTDKRKQKEKEDPETPASPSRTRPNTFTYFYQTCFLKSCQPWSEAYIIGLLELLKTKLQQLGNTFKSTDSGLLSKTKQIGVSWDIF